MKIDHIAIAVNDVEESVNIFFSGVFDFFVAILSL